MKIVIVEDEMKTRTGMSHLISAHTEHIVVAEARNGKEGLEVIQKFRPDLVISDIRMPVMDGLEMLKKMRETGCLCRCVVLSGYSEFEYAQKAIQYGVEAYLLKPLAPEDVIQMLDSIQRKLDEQQIHQEQTKEGLLRSILIGGKNGQRKETELLEKFGMFSGDQPLYLILVYVGNTNMGYQEQIGTLWEKSVLKEKNCLCCQIMLEHMQQISILLQGDISQEVLCAEIERRAYRHLEETEEPVWALVRMDTLYKLQEAMDCLLEQQSFGIWLGYRKVLTRERIETLKLQEYVYPRQLESAIQNAVCRGTAEQLQKVIEQFQDAVLAVPCEPRYVKRAYQKCYHFVSHILQETNYTAYKAAEESEVERLLGSAVTLGELDYALNRLVQIINELRDKKADIRNYTILKAINYIKEHYQENLSLDQLADFLEMTPEYLSTLFNREMGINFSTFLKQFRISHAKRLLKGSDRKIYEIASEVGYNDPKYFNRVFKEVTGISPGDFRQQL